MKLNIRVRLNLAVGFDAMISDMATVRLYLRWLTAFLALAIPVTVHIVAIGVIVELATGW